MHCAYVYVFSSPSNFNYLSDRIRLADLCSFAIVISKAPQFLDANIVLAILKFWTTGVTVARRLTYAADAQLVSHTISRQVTFHCYTNKTISDIV